MAAPRLRIWSSRSYLPPDGLHVTALYPFWGRPPGLAVAWPDYADRFIERGSDFLELTELEQADVAIFPEEWKRTARAADGLARARAFATVAREAGKPYAVFFEGDSTEPLPLEDATVLRTSLLRSRRRPREFALPGFHEDLLRYCGGELPIREKLERATVSFCGVALAEEERHGVGGRVRRALVERRRAVLERLGRPLPQDVFVRSRALDALRGQPHVDTSIVVRAEGGGGAMYPRPDPELWPKVRAEYVRNMVESDYVLCARGVGNFSWRLYEALSVGRIPVFVDTDCVLPYDFHLDWGDHVVWLDRPDVPRIGERVAAFHERLTPSEFLDRQRACRRLWEDYLRPEGFFANLWRHFAER